MQPDVEVVGEAGNGLDGINFGFRIKTRCGCYGFGNARNERCRSDIEASGRMERAKILVLTSYLDNEKIYPVIEAGAKGYMLKTSSAAENF